METGIRFSASDRKYFLFKIFDHIDHDIIPVVPEKGSVGASGDLAPLAHLFLPLIGLGKVFVKIVTGSTTRPRETS